MSSLSKHWLKPHFDLSTEAKLLSVSVWFDLYERANMEEVNEMASNLVGNAALTTTAVFSCKWPLFRTAILHMNSSATLQVKVSTTFDYFCTIRCNPVHAPFTWNFASSYFTKVSSILSTLQAHLKTLVVAHLSANDPTLRL